VRPFPLKKGVVLQILNVGPGIMAEDNYEISLRLEPGSHVVIVNQSATKLHRMPEGQKALQRLRIQIAEGARLELYPGITIPYPGSDFRQEIEVEVHPQAEFATLELWAMGRVGRGETFRFRRLSNRLKVVTTTGSDTPTPLYSDGLELTGKKGANIGLTDGHPYLVAGVCYSDFPWSNEIVEREDATLVAGTVNPKLSYARGIARDGVILRRTVQTWINNWREASGLEAISFERFGS
jgi:urease accessory protein UreH